MLNAAVLQYVNFSVARQDCICFMDLFRQVFTCLSENRFVMIVGETCAKFDFSEEKYQELL